MSWYVEHLRGDGSVLTRLAVAGGIFRIGRDLDNDLVLDDPYCAAFHAELHIGPNGSAQLRDLGTKNGILAQGGKRQTDYDVATDSPYKLGNSQIRMRNRVWPLPPEMTLSRRLVWPIALLTLILVLGRGAWDIWLTDLSDKPPTYLIQLSGMAVALSVWSAAYALLGRLLGGVDRFFNHFLIAGVAFLSAATVRTALELLAFSGAWLWPMRIAPYVTVVIIALTVRAHLRVADPRHWPVLRWSVATAATLAITIPLAQIWISQHRLTNVQVLTAIEHPKLRLAQPTSISSFMASTQALKARVDQARTNDSDGATEADADDSD